MMTLPSVDADTFKPDDESFWDWMSASYEISLGQALLRLSEVADANLTSAERATLRRRADTHLHLAMAIMRYQARRTD